MTDSSSGVDPTTDGPAGHPHALEVLDDADGEYTFAPAVPTPTSGAPGGSPPTPTPSSTSGRGAETTLSRHS